MTAGTLPVFLLDRRSLWVRLVLVFGLCLTAVQAARAVKCEQHLGPFGPAFTSAYDINHLDCRLSEVATLRLWTVPPYADVDLHLPR